MVTNPDLDRLIALERYARMLAALNPRELAVIALRLEGLPFNHAGEILGLSRQAVFQRMYYCRKRLLILFPHIRAAIGEKQQLLEGLATPQDAAIGEMPASTRSPKLPQSPVASEARQSLLGHDRSPGPATGCPNFGANHRQSGAVAMPQPLGQDFMAILQRLSQRRIDPCLK